MVFGTLVSAKQCFKLLNTGRGIVLTSSFANSKNISNWSFGVYSIQQPSSLFLKRTLTLYPLSRYVSSTAQLKGKDGSGNIDENETHGQPLHSFGSSHKREQASNRFDAGQQGVNSVANDYQPDLASAHHADVYNHNPAVSLSACMQSQVPEPYGKTPTHMNMPGGVNRREDKYLQGRLLDVSSDREFSTSSRSETAYVMDEHGNLTYTTDAIEKILHDPCPQGIQGEDCEQFKIWLSNCMEYGDLLDCERLANEYIAGRKTLAQLFLEYDFEIKRAAMKVQQQVGNAEHLVMFSNPTNNSNQSVPHSDTNSHSPTPEPQGDDKPSARNARVARLKAAVRDYGSLVIVFHVGISLISLGFFYVLVASNVDIVSILNYFSITLGSAQSSIETASTFALAYAVHKIFAPVRIGITLTCVPLIVRSLRTRGILKAPPRKSA